MLRWHCATALIAINALYGFIRDRGTWTAYVAQPIVVGLVAYGLRPKTAREWGLVTLYAAGSFVGTVGGVSVPDVVGVGVLLYLAYRESHAAVLATLAAIEAAVVATLFATADTDEVALRSEHYTWWSITVVCGVGRAAGGGRLPRHPGRAGSPGSPQRCRWSCALGCCTCRPTAARCSPTRWTRRATGGTLWATF